MLDGVITEVEDISDEEFPDFRVHALIAGQMQVFRVWLRTYHNEWAVYGADGHQYVSAFPTRSEAMAFIGRAA
ncbi:MAG: hypothetical protein WCF12_03075 [Propionicimonas sp.]